MLDIESTMLFDYYAKLLTENQRQTLDLYFNQDLSLAEIAERQGTSRQAAMDALRRGVAAMEELESRLGLYSICSRAAKLARHAGQCLDKNDIEGAKGDLKGIISVLEDENGV